MLGDTVLTAVLCCFHSHRSVTLTATRLEHSHVSAPHYYVVPSHTPSLLLNSKKLLMWWEEQRPRVIRILFIHSLNFLFRKYEEIMRFTHAVSSIWFRQSPVQTGPGVHPACCAVGTGSFPGVKRPGRGADHPLPSKCRGQERVGLYLYSPSGPSWPVIGRTFSFTHDFGSKLRMFCYTTNTLYNHNITSCVSNDVLTEVSSLLCYITMNLVALIQCVKSTKPVLSPIRWLVQ